MPGKKQIILQLMCQDLNTPGLVILLYHKKNLPECLKILNDKGELRQSTWSLELHDVYICTGSLMPCFPHVPVFGTPVSK